MNRAVKADHCVNISVLRIILIKQIMSTKLQDFMCFLHENKLVDIHSVRRKDEVGSINRLKLQKYVYLAQSCLNNDFGYEFNMYNNGPYSPELANYYYEKLDINAIESDIMNKNWKLDAGFIKRFLDLFKNKELDWLVVASTLVDNTNYFEEEQEILNKVYAMKSDYSKSYIDDVWNDLKDYALVKYESGLKLNSLLSAF
ncbi:conserved protein of unknown function [Candidatus Nitrosocosmicus franklandus]|uniref:Uncharacterized protein n=1 Tax=Candidatus Nitrosocosmicus franklandianus TaxID=1798806 RepID=A0A484IDM6_9ARCH|nr:conserved protein of unknown function [Candidatus Nitrosocosmicus franklandus]